MIEWLSNNKLDYLAGNKNSLQTFFVGGVCDI